MVSLIPWRISPTYSFIGLLQPSGDFGLVTVDDAVIGPMTDG